VGSTPSTSADALAHGHKRVSLELPPAAHVPALPKKHIELPSWAGSFVELRGLSAEQKESARPALATTADMAVASVTSAKPFAAHPPKVEHTASQLMPTAGETRHEMGAGCVSV
jgi:hypothetical protein